MRRSHADEPVLITTAAESSQREYDQRRKKYVVMMGLRALCVIGAATTYKVSLWLALAFIVGGMVLPWCAVIIANDRPAKKKAERVGYRADLRTERALPPGADDSRTVDG
jgi:Flp pilus assembly protein TadB